MCPTTVVFRVADMNSRILLAIAAALALCLALGAWWHVRTDESRPAVVVPESETFSRTAPSAELTDAPRASAAGDARVVPARQPTLSEQQSASHGSTGRLTGRVTSKAGNAAVMQAELTARRMGQPPKGTAASAACRADEKGQFEFAALESGNWTIRCGAYGFATAEQTTFVLDDDRRRVLDFVLEPSVPPQELIVHLHGPDGRPLRDPMRDARQSKVALIPYIVCLEACPSRGAELPADARIMPHLSSALQPDDVGRLNVPAESDDAWFRVKLEHQTSGCCCLIRGKRVLDAVPFSPGTTRIDMTVSPSDVPPPTGALRLTLVDDVSGKPVAWTSVIVRYADKHSGGAGGDELGKVYIDQLTVGYGVAEITAEEYEKAELPVVIRPGVDTDLGVVRLHAK
jgi:hypothetical protein